ncbi:MAG TPA: hypothetical protein VJ694_04260 [Patescibacteria group bacterium]|nr:hypothetical protein [Patescibacteria group bacterium]
MRTVLAAVFILAASVPAAHADEAKPSQYLESQTDIGGVAGSNPAFKHRWLTRTFFNVNDEENAFEAHYGLAWRPRRHFWVDVTAGWSYTSDGPVAGNTLLLGVWKQMSFFDEKLRVKLEGLHRFGDGYRYEGVYSLDYAVVGVHVLNVGREAAAGFQFGSGYGLLPFRVDIRISFGLTDGMPERASRFIMSFDFR